MMVISFFAGLWLAQLRAPKFGVDREVIVDGMIPILFAGVIGARLFYIAQDWGYFSTHPEDLWTLRFSGLTSFGGIVFGIGAAIIFCHRKGIPFFRFADLIAPCFLLGHAIGRIGCFLNGCCFGRQCPADFPLGVRMAGHTDLQHPAQLYDTLMNVIALFALISWEKRPRGDGQSFGFMLILHGAARYIYEIWRAGTVADVEAGRASSTTISGLPITEAQVAALLVVLIGMVIMVVANRKAHAQQELLAS